METYTINTDITVTDRSPAGITRARDNLGRFVRQSDAARRSAQALSRQRFGINITGNASAAMRAISQVRAAVTSLVRMPARIAISILDKTGSALRGIRQTVGGALRPIGAIASPIGAIATGAAVAGGVAAAGIMPLQLAGQLEQAQIGFETMLGSAERARSFLGELQDFAARTPFEFPELRGAGQRLLAVGFAAENVIPTLTAVGNAASALGAGTEGINRVVTAFGQMQAKGRVQSEELMQLQELGVPALQMLTAGFQREGEAIRDSAHMQELVTAGAVPARRAIRLLTEEMNRKFPNMMEKQSASLLGLWSTMRDTFSTKVVTRWGQGLQAAIQPRMAALVGWLGSNDAAVTEFGNGLEGLGKQIGGGLMGAVEGLVRSGGDLFGSAEWKNAPTLLDKLGVLGGRAFDYVLERMGPAGVALRWWYTEGLPKVWAGAVTAFGWVRDNVLPILGQFRDGLGGGLVDAATWWINTGWPGIQSGATTAGIWVEKARVFFADVHAEMERLGVYTDLSAAWGNIRDIGTELVGVGRDLGTYVLPGVGAEAGNVAKAFDDGRTPAQRLAGDIKDLTRDLRDITKAIADVIRWVRSLGEWWAANDDLIKGALMLGSPATAGQGMALIGKHFMEQAAKGAAADRRNPINNPAAGDVLYSGPPGSPAEEAAIKKGLGLVGSSTMEINGQLETVVNACERFVEHLFGVTGQASTAMQGAAKFMTNPAPTTPGGRAEAMAAAPRGAMMYFNNAADTGGAGHAAMALGDGSFLSTTAEGVKVIKPGDDLYSYYERYYMGSGRASFGTAAGERKYAAGGWINEPVQGVGMRSGARYKLGEAGPEYVSSGRPSAGSGGGLGAVYAPVSVSAPISLSFPNVTAVDEAVIRRAVAAGADDLLAILAQAGEEAGANMVES